MPVYSHSYDSWHYDPAMPVVEIALLSPETGVSLIQLTALVETGADATMLPANVLEAAGARYVQTLRLRGVTEQSLSVETFVTIVRLGPHTVYGVQAVAMPVGSEAIIGRDVLNELEITLNGPAHELWSNSKNL